MTRILLVSLLWAAPLWGLAVVYSADPNAAREQGRPAPSAMRISEAKVDVQINGRLALTRFDQTFTNNTGSGAGFCEFDLPPGAVITDLVLTVNGQRVPGYILRAGADFQNYVIDQVRGTGSARIEKVSGHANRYRLPITSFRSGQRRLEVEYIERIQGGDDGLRYRFPLKRALDSGAAIQRLSLTATLRGRQIAVRPFSVGPDPVRLRGDGRGGFVASYAKRDAPPAADFELVYSDATPLPYIMSWAPIQRAEWGYYALWGSLPADFPPEKLIYPATTFLFDTAAPPEAYEAIQGALAATVARLSPRARFNLVAVGQKAQAFAPEPVPADTETKRRALRFVADLPRGRGMVPARNLENALRLALKPGTGDRRANDVVLLLTGPPNSGTTATERLRDLADERRDGPLRLTVIGLGQAAPRLEGLASGWGQDAFFLESAPGLSGRLSRLLARFTRPALPFARMEVDGVATRDVLPRRPAYWLRRGEEFFQTGRYRGIGPVRVALTDDNDQQLLSFGGELPLKPSEEPEVVYRDGDVLLYEDFDDGVADGWKRATGGFWEVAQGVFRQRQNISGVYRSYAHVDAASYTIEVGMRINKHDEQGKIIYTNANRLEEWRVDFFGGGHTVRLINHRLGGYTSRALFPIQTGRWHTMTVAVGNGIVQTQVNGQEVHHRIPLSTAPDGYIGIGSYSSGMTDFDYVRVTAGTAARANILAVSVEEERRTDLSLRTEAFIPRLWGGLQTAGKEERIALEGASPGLLEEIEDLGIKYRLLTPRTSMIIPGDVGPAAAPRSAAAVTAVSDAADSLGTAAASPGETVLGPNWPNPFNASTAIEVEVNADIAAKTLSLSVFNAAGQRVRRLHRGALPAGTHRFVWDGLDQEGREAGSGVYLARVVTAQGTAIRRMLLLR